MQKKSRFSCDFWRKVIITSHRIRHSYSMNSPLILIEFAFNSRRGWHFQFYSSSIFIFPLIRWWYFEFFPEKVLSLTSPPSNPYVQGVWGTWGMLRNPHPRVTWPSLFLAITLTFWADDKFEKYLTFLISLSHFFLFMSRNSTVTYTDIGRHI